MKTTKRTYSFLSLVTHPITVAVIMLGLYILVSSLEFAWEYAPSLN